MPSYPNVNVPCSRRTNPFDHRPYLKYYNLLLMYFTLNDYSLNSGLERLSLDIYLD